MLKLRLYFSAVHCALLCALCLGQLLLGGAMAADRPKHQTDNFKSETKRIATLWHHIPFYAGADLGQYQATMAQNRSEVRKQLLAELSNTLGTLADKGAPAESMLEPLANIILMFDQMHDLHKARDVANINISLESQFKAALDQAFLRNDVRDAARKIQISRGTEPELLQYYLRGIGTTNPQGKTKTTQSVKIQYAMEVYNQIDYTAFGTFTHLGHNQFQVTLHMHGFKNGVTRNFISHGSLTAALNYLANDVFDYFQRTEYPDWSAPQDKLTWLPMPVNPNRCDIYSNSQGYTFEESQTYCLERGFRLPYARELLSAEAGGAYKQGGISHLVHGVHYAVRDKRRLNANYALHVGQEQRSGGAIQSISNTEKGVFWCVKGTPAASAVLYELLWRLHRKHKSGDGSNKAIYAAVTTIRYELGDADTEIVYYHNTVSDNMFDKVKRFESIDEALEVLKSQDIEIQIPGYARPGP